MKRGRSLFSTCLILTVFSLVYFITAKFGLEINALNHFATTLWPPSGIAVATLLLGGLDLWPGVMLGAFLINFYVGAPPLVAAGIGFGNMLEAVVAAYLCSRPPGFRRNLTHLRDVLRLVVYAAMLSPVVSASVGVASLWWGGLLTGAQLETTWLQWWVGDGLGILTLAPLLLILGSRDPRKERWSARKIAEFVVLTVALLAGNIFVFSDFGAIHALREALIFPLLLWATIRFGVRGAVLATFVTSTVAIWSTAHNVGPFATGPIAERLVQLLSFVAIVALLDLVVGVIVGELVRSQRSLTHALSERDLFFSIASHELRTPLTTLKLRLQMTQKALANEKPQTGRDLLRETKLALRQVDSLTRLVDDLLDTARMRTGHFSLSLEPVDLMPLVEETVQRLSEQLTAANCPVQLDLRMASGFWDRRRLEQVLVNLLSNVIKYAPNGLVNIRTYIENNSAIMVIKDSGPGIELAKQARIFESFERLSQKTAEGLGLGLFIARNIVDAHRGSISVHSEMGGGSLFRVELPLYPVSQ